VRLGWSVNHAERVTGFAGGVWDGAYQRKEKWISPLKLQKWFKQTMAEL
jgi:hypothetical protein